MENYKIYMWRDLVAANGAFHTDNAFAVARTKVEAVNAVLLDIVTNESSRYIDIDYTEKIRWLLESVTPEVYDLTTKGFYGWN